MKKVITIFFALFVNLILFCQQRALKDLSLSQIGKVIKTIPHPEKTIQLTNLNRYQKNKLPADFTYALNGVKLEVTDSVDLSKVICIDVMAADYANHTSFGAYAANINFFYDQDTSLVQIQKLHKTFFYVDKGAKVYFEESEIEKFSNKKLFQLLVDTSSEVIVYKGIDNFFKFTNLGYLAWDKTAIMCEGGMLTRYVDFFKVNTTSDNVSLTITQGAGIKYIRKNGFLK